MNIEAKYAGLEVGYDVPALPGMSEDEIQTPCLILDLDALERNIRKMGDYAKAHNMRHRAHGKMHKSVDVLRLQQELGGAVGVCCQKVSEAEVFARAGIKDVLVSNQVRHRRQNTEGSMNTHFDEDTLGLRPLFMAMMDDLNDGERVLALVRLAACVLLAPVARSSQAAPIEELAQPLTHFPEVRHGVDLSHRRRPVRDRLGDRSQIYRRLYPPAAVAVDHRQHDSEHRPARAGAQDAAGRDRLRGMDRNRCGRNRGALHLSVRGTRDRVAADIHRLDPVRYRRPQAGHLDCWTVAENDGENPDRVSLRLKEMGRVNVSQKPSGMNLRSGT